MKKLPTCTSLFGVLVLAACSSGNGGEGTTYEQQLSCYITLMGVNAVNRETGSELPGATNALLLMKARELEGGEKEQQVKDDIHQASSKIQDIMALQESPEGVAELAKLQTEAETCSAQFKN